MKAKEKQRAIELRQSGWSYNQIAKEVDVSKSTLSVWLSDITLTEEQEKTLSERSRIQGIKGGQNRRAYWRARRHEIHNNYEPPISNPYFMLGLGLYWGEGSKHSRTEVSMSNADVHLLKCYMVWMRDYFMNAHNDFVVSILHYNPQNDQLMKEYWSQQLDIPVEQFYKSQYGVSKSSLGKRSTLPFGTAKVRVVGKGVWAIQEKIHKALLALSSSG